MKKIDYRYKNLAISKFHIKNLHLVTTLNKINFTVATPGTLKFIFKNLIWLMLLISGQKIYFNKQKIRRKNSSKTVLTSFKLTIRKNNFYIINKILTIILPNQENRIMTQVNWNKNFVLSFKKCLTYSELDTIVKNKMNMLIKNFHILLNFSSRNSELHKDFFILRFLQFPIKK